MRIWLAATSLAATRTAVTTTSHRGDSSIWSSDYNRRTHTVIDGHVCQIFIHYVTFSLGLHLPRHRLVTVIVTSRPTSVVEYGRISTHADLRPHAARYSTKGTSLACRLRWGKDIHHMQYFQVVANWSDFKLLGEKKFPKGGDFLPRTPMNHRAKLDAANFILAG